MTINNCDENLLICLKNNPLAKVKIICFPFAGGGASFFYKWINEIHDSAEIYSIALPGRESKFQEIPYEHYKPLVQSLSKNIMRELGEEDLIFFGHSLGSIISYEVSQYLMEHYSKVPKKLFVSSCKAPRYFNNTENLINLSKQEIINKLRDINGTPIEILESEELLDFYIPVIKSDFKICDSYKYYHNNKVLHCPITVFGGTEDTIEIEELYKWSEETDQLFKVRLFEGDHFYLESNRKYVIESITNSIV